MLIDLNGMEFHLRVCPAAHGRGFDVAIVDEAFCQPAMKTHAFSIAGILGLLEHYSGLDVDAHTSEQVRRHIAQMMVPEKIAV